MEIISIGGRPGEAARRDGVMFSTPGAIAARVLEDIIEVVTGAARHIAKEREGVTRIAYATAANINAVEVEVIQPCDLKHSGNLESSGSRGPVAIYTEADHVVLVGALAAIENDPGQLACLVERRDRERVDHISLHQVRGRGGESAGDSGDGIGGRA